MDCPIGGSGPSARRTTQGTPEDDIAGRYGCAFYDEKLIWVNMRYADDPVLVLEILLHEVAHALLSPQEGDQHGEEFWVKLWEIGGRVVDATAVLS